MPKNYDIVYPSKGRVRFTGGLNSKIEKGLIEDNESPDCFNVVFNDGAVGTREGTAQLNTTAIGSFVGQGLYTRDDNDGSQTMIAFAGGTAWQLGTTTFTTIPSAQSVFTAGTRIACEQYQNNLYAGNGGVIPYKYDGTDWTRHGVYPPDDSTISAVCGGAGALTGDYQYKVSYVNSQAVEGDVNTATTTLNVASGEISLTSLPVAPQSWGVASRRIYRTEAGGTTFYRVTEIADNSTTSYTDNNTDASINGNSQAPTDAGVPPKYSSIVYHQNRVFCNDSANTNYIWYSDLNEPYTFASTNFFRVGDNSSDLVKGLFVYDNSIIVLCENSIHKLYMPSTTPSDWVMLRLRSNFGSKSAFAPFLWNNSAMFAAMQNDKMVGFASLSGSTIDPQATTSETSAQLSELTSQRIESDVFDIREANVGDISSTVFKNKAYITVPYGSGATRNNRVYIFDFSLGTVKPQDYSWAPTDTDAVSATQFTVYDGKLYFLSSRSDGLVYELLDGTYSDGASTAIDSYFWTKEFSGLPGHEELQKDFRSVSLLVDKAGAYTMDLAIRVDSDQGVGVSQQIDLDPGSTVWNSFTWDSSEWGSGSSQEEVTIYLGQVTGKRIQFKFSNKNTADQRFKVHGLKFTYNLKGKR
jgi:hypothetical protein